MPTGWRKSSLSGVDACIEVRFGPSDPAGQPSYIELRETAQPDVVIRISPESWRAFTAAVSLGEFGPTH